MLEREIAPGIHRIEDAYTNWYLVEAAALHSSGLRAMPPRRFAASAGLERELGPAVDKHDLAGAREGRRTGDEEADRPGGRKGYALPASASAVLTP